MADARVTERLEAGRQREERLAARVQTLEQSLGDSVTIGMQQEARITALEQALQSVMQVLGPTEPKHDGVCDGCQWEIGEALRLIREAGIEYRTRKHVLPPAGEREET